MGRGCDFRNRLFGLEKEYESQSPEERYRARLERSKPVFEEFCAWSRSVAVLPKSALGEALHYAFEQRPYLESVFLDGRLELSNTGCSRRQTPKGTKASSVIYSVIETAKENLLNPFAYRQHIFERVPNIGLEEYDRLPPWSNSLPEGCKIPQK